ncbi:MAG: HigA family addiction module antitoxin [Candidatus Binataceae bacterium]
MSKKIAPVHPGEVLREEFMLPTNTSINKLALDLHVSPTRIFEIVRGQRAITADTALRLSRHLGTAPDFWLGLQMQYDLEKARDETAALIEREVRPRAA